MSEELIATNNVGGIRYVKLDNLRSSFYVAISELGVFDALDTNVALGCTATASSYLDENRAPRFLVDGDVGTVWHAGNTSTNWVLLDLGKPIDIVSVRIWPVTYDPAYSPTQWDLYLGKTLEDLVLVSSGRTRLPAGWTNLWTKNV